MGPNPFALCQTTILMSNRPRQKTGAITLAGLALASGLLLGCKGIPTQDERHARQELKTVAETYRPDGKQPVLPPLHDDAGLSNYLNYALLNQPQVEAAYYDWVASIERITVERSLPDPQLTFQMDIQSIVTSIMPGLMMSFPGAGPVNSLKMHSFLRQSIT